MPNEHHPDHRRQREEHEAHPRLAEGQGLRDARSDDRRGRCAPRARAPTRSRADGHPAARHQRHRGLRADSRRRGHCGDSRRGIHRVGHADRSQPHHPSRVQRIGQHADPTEGVPRHGEAHAGRRRINTQPTILVVDDTPANVKLLVDVLAAKGYAMLSAADGEEALARIAEHTPDIVLLDIMMPGLSGYEVCRRIRADPSTALLPVVLCTSLNAHEERINGIEAGADDFLSKPVNQQELFSRVKSLLRIKSLQDEVKTQAAQLARWNETLEARVREQVGELERLARLKRFFSPPLAEAIVQGGGEELLKAHRREINVVFIDLRGFTAFTDRAEPEEVMELLQVYHATMGRIVLAHDGTLERFAGDSLMVFFNDPLPIARPAEQAVRMALAMQQAFPPLGREWNKRGYELALGCGIAQGYATLGAIGFEGRWDYAAIGSVTNLAARLCAEAAGGQVLIDRKTMAKVEDLVEASPVGPLNLKGFAQSVAAFTVAGLKPAG